MLIVIFKSYKLTFSVMYLNWNFIDFQLTKNIFADSLLRGSYQFFLLWINHFRRFLATQKKMTPWKKFSASNCKRMAKIALQSLNTNQWGRVKRSKNSNLFGRISCPIFDFKMCFQWTVSGLLNEGIFPWYKLIFFLLTRNCNFPPKEVIKKVEPS